MVDVVDAVAGYSEETKSRAEIRPRTGLVLVQLSVADLQMFFSSLVFFWSSCGCPDVVSSSISCWSCCLWGISILGTQTGWRAEGTAADRESEKESFVYHKLTNIYGKLSPLIYKVTHRFYCPIFKLLTGNNSFSRLFQGATQNWPRRSNAFFFLFCYGGVGKQLNEELPPPTGNRCGPNES